MKKVNILFMGTPEIAVAMLSRLLEDKYRIVGVVTQPDKKIGRKQLLTMPPVKELALAHDIPVYQPVSIKEEYEQLRDNVSAYVKFNATNLLKLAVDRETKREKYELKKWKAFGDAIKEGKSCNDAFIAGLRATDNPTSEDE